LQTFPQDIVSTVNWEALTAVTIALGVVILVVEFLAALWCLAHYAYVNEVFVEQNRLSPAATNAAYRYTVD
jgi:hypothetical protein